MLKKGVAKTVFSETYQRRPWQTTQHEKTVPQWPLVEQLLAQQRISYLDYVLTHRLLRNFPECKQEAALFICHLSLAIRKGHLCVRVDENTLHPSISEIWQNEEGEALEESETSLLTQSILEGVKTIPEGLITAISSQLNPSDLHPTTPLCREGLDFYLQRYWMFETLFLSALKKHLQSPLQFKLNLSDVEGSVQQLVEQNTLLPEQAQAILEGCKNSLTVITGGPGTGKTYTAGYLIKIFWQHLTKEQQKSYRIVLAAPTGKAAANLQQSLSKVISTLEDFPPIQAKTLHSLLGLKQNSPEYSQVHFSEDLIVVDESSMIDIKMMAYLFGALKAGSRIILLGDEHQLPSVEAGSVFQDIIQVHNVNPSLKLSCIHLHTCLRAELKSLIDFAKLVNSGEGEKVLAALEHPVEPGIKRLRLAEDKKEAQRELVRYALCNFKISVTQEENPKRLLELFNSMRLLSPMKLGPFGVEELNQQIWRKISQSVDGCEWLPIPIMILTNDHRQELFNGETGVLMRKLPLQTIGKDDYALFPSREEGKEVRRIAAIVLPKYEYAYCISVYKSQGSEFDRVILVLPEGSEYFGREVFYTAVTRAKREIDIFGTDEVIKKTVEQKGGRQSGIQKRLLEWD